MAVKYEKCTARKSCVVHFLNGTDKDLYVGDELQVGGLTARVVHDMVCVGKKGSAEFKSNQAFLNLTLSSALSQDYGFGETLVAPDGKEFIVVGTHNKMGEWGGVAAPAGTKCPQVIDPCCLDKDPNSCVCKITDFENPATTINSIQIGSGPEINGPWTQANYQDVATGIGTALASAGFGPADGCDSSIEFTSSQLVIDGYDLGAHQLSVDYS